MKLKAFKSNLISLLIMSLLLTGCAQTGLAHESNFDSNYSNEQEMSENIYVCSAEVMFRGIDVENSILVFDMTNTGEVLSLYYDGTTIVTDKYSNPMTVGQLNKGDILNIAYSSSLGKVGAIVYSPEAFCYTGIEKYHVSENEQSLVVGDEVYSITPNTKIYSDGQEITLAQLINNDTITIQGKDHYIYSVRVDTGHGYLELSNYDALIGGWIEVGQTVISQIGDGMLFTVPEGIYKVHLTNTGIDEYRDLIILRNEVALLDCSDIESVTPDKGIVSFKIFPEGAVTYVDDEKIDTRYAIRLSVGIHEVRAEASGYSTVTQYFNVDGTRQNVYMDLEETSSNNSVSGNSMSKNLYTSLTIEAPVGAEVYEDNIYKGVAPVSFKKTEGTHILTFKKSGYVTTSYTIYLENDGRDETMSFADLVEDKNTVSGNSINTNGEVTKSDDSSRTTVSGNTVSGNSVSPSPSASPSASPSPSPTT